MSGRGAGRGRGRGRGRAGSPKKTKTKKGKVGAKGSKGGSKVVVVPEEHAEERRSGSEDEEERPELELEEDRGSEEGDAPPETGTGRPEEGEDGGLEGTGESWSAQRLRDETLIAEFFDARPYFYNKRDENYKRTQMKNAEMADLVKELGGNWTHDTVMKRFWSNRTDFGKLRDKIKKTPSGSGASSMTPIQKWKLRNWAFVEPYIKKRKNPGADAEMGKVSRSRTEHSDEEEDEQEPSTSTGITTAAGHHPPRRPSHQQLPAWQTP